MSFDPLWKLARASIGRKKLKMSTDNDFGSDAMTNFSFYRDLPDGSAYRLGTAVHYADGWRFISNVTSHKSSRKFHATMKKCLPRWLGYPDQCRSVAMRPSTDELSHGAR